MGDEFKIDPAALRTAAGELRSSASEVESYGETLGAATEAPVGEGTLGQVVADAVKRGIKIVEKGFTDAVKTFHEASAAGLEKVAAETERVDGEASTAFKDLEHGPHEEFPGGTRPVNLEEPAAEGNILTPPASHGGGGDGLPPEGQLSTKEPPGRVELRNGYTYTIDGSGRTTSVEGDLVMNLGQGRNEAAQLAAGGSDRLPTDQGGHFIGRRFDGPLDDFNHFAQDRNFNNSAYKSLENSWKKAIVNNGSAVHVSIQAGYSGGSLRPETIDVFYTIDGQPFQKLFKNRPGGL